MYQRILVPIDGSEPSKLALHEAIKLAKAGQSALRILHIVDVYQIRAAVEPAYVPTSYYDQVIQSWRTSGERTLTEAVEQVKRAGLQPDPLMVEAGGESVAAQILTEAQQWNADLIVMGTHGRRGIGRLLMGSDAEFVVRSASVPVLLVRDRTGAR